MTDGMPAIHKLREKLEAVIDAFSSQELTTAQLIGCLEMEITAQAVRLDEPVICQQFIMRMDELVLKAVHTEGVTPIEVVGLLRCFQFDLMMEAMSDMDGPL